jgi:GNAT superfamily N-acetyltransferase
VELRPTTVADLPALHALFLASLGGVFRSHGFEPPSPTLEVFAAQQGQVLATGTCFVAEEHDGRPAGYVSAWARGDDWFLGSLFIAPKAQGRGVGSALLDAAWGDHPRRRTITDAIQPISNALYGRRGLLPATPVLTFTGRPRTDAVVEPGDASLAAVDTVAYGFDRSVDHAYWARFGRRTTWPGAYSYVFPGGAIGPVGGLGPQAAAAALQSELARADEAVTVRIPGSSRALLEVALRAKLRLAPVPGLLLLSDGLQPPDALAIASYTLF